MNTKNFKKEWKSYIPESFHWLEKLTIATVSTFDPKSTHLVCVETPKDKDAAVKWQIDATNLTEEQKKQITDQATTLGWQGKGALSVVCNQTVFVLLPVSSLDVSVSQKGRQLGLDAAAHLGSKNISSVTLTQSSKLSFEDLFDGFCQGYYSLDTFKGPKPSTPAPGSSKFPTSLFIWGTASQDEISRWRTFATSLTITRWLEDAPPNWLTSERFAEVAQGLGADSGFKCTVRGREELEKLGFGCFTSVAGGSKRDPKFIVMEVAGKDTSKNVVLVGKGLTFDSGGISLKPSQGMEEMKYDMCGGASVLGSMYYLSKFKPQTNVIGMIGAVENMPGEEATRPSDIVTAYNQKTVEILNTDAEGRLVLCDMLAYASKNYKPALMVDIATLTGAVIIALGAFGSAIVTNRQRAADYVLGLSRKVGEPVWQLPLWPELASEIKSTFADYKNIPNASVKAGTIVAAQYLKEFVEETPWVHIDIAGTGWGCKATGYPTSGGTGFGLRLLTEICRQFEGDMT